MTMIEANPALSVVADLRATFATGRTRTRAWREAQLDGIVRLCEEREADIAAAMTEDLGRDAHGTWFADIASTVGEARYARKHLRSWMRPTRTRLPLALQPGRGSFHYEPLGVVMVIGPWNVPLYLTLGPLVGALAAGNCAVLKPSEHAPAASALMAGLVPQYLDPDAVKVVEGDATATQQLIDARLDHIFFTGGTEVGRKIMQAAAPHLTPVTLELGGKSPVIVTRHADLDVTARRIIWGKIINSGQTCLAPDYVLVEDSVRDALVTRLERELAAMRRGEAPAQQVVNERQHARLMGLLRSAGGSFVTGGSASGLSIEPTIVLEPDPGSDLMHQEVFGPILPVTSVASLDAAIAHVNSGEKPLAAYVFSKDRGEQRRVVAEVACGGVVVNHVIMHVLAPQLPFGGVGDSGMGGYHGKWGYEAFSHRKATLRMPTRPDLRLVYPPYSERDKKLLRHLA